MLYTQNKVTIYKQTIKNRGWESGKMDASFPDQI